MELNEKLTILRKSKQLSQAQVAEALDVSRQAISNWETGAVLPSTDNLKSLSQLYQVPVDRLLNSDNNIDLFTASAAETSKVSNTNGRLVVLKIHTAIILFYLITLILVVVISVAVTLFLTREKEPDVLDVSDLNIEYVDPATVEDGEMW